MSRVIAVGNQKGGVGKTTTAVNLAANLAAADLRTLLVDMDPQANATSGLGVRVEPGEPTVYEVLSKQVSVARAAISGCFEGLHVLPANRSLAGAQIELVSVERREYRLREVLESVRKEFDFVLIDSPPSLGLLTLNALTAADSVLIPMQCEYYALEGLSYFLETVERIRATLNLDLGIEGILLTMADRRTNLSRQVEEDVRQHFPGLVFETVVPRNVRLSEAPSYGQPIVLYDLRSPGAQAYLQLMHEVVKNG